MFKASKNVQNFDQSRFQGIYWRAHRTATLTLIQHTVMGEEGIKTSRRLLWMVPQALSLLYFLPDEPIWTAQQRSIFYGFISGTSNLTCGARAEPPATFTWYDKIGKPIQKGAILTENHISTLVVRIYSSFNTVSNLGKNQPEIRIGNSFDLYFILNLIPFFGRELNCWIVILCVSDQMLLNYFQIIFDTIGHSHCSYYRTAIRFINYAFQVKGSESSNFCKLMLMFIPK